MHSFRNLSFPRLHGHINLTIIASIRPPSRSLWLASETCGRSLSSLQLHHGRPMRRNFATKPPSSRVENTNVGHARFLAEAKQDDDWRRGEGNALKGGIEGTGNELEGVGPGKGKLCPTSSHLFKLILPLSDKQPPTVFLLHPSQPLSHVSRLISASLPGRPISIFFRSAAESIAQRDNLQTTEALQGANYDGRDEVQWADSTDIGDFTKACISAARSNNFRIVIEEDDKTKYGATSKTGIEVSVPTFEKRTIYLKSRLDWLGQRLREMENIKKACDAEAHASARRLALGGLALLVTYWVGVFRLTFWDYGWDIMEPVSYLSGLSMIILGYLWFLYQGREVSYSSVMNTSVSRRRSQLYESRGFDIERWTDLVTEEKAIKQEISKIAQDYGIEWSTNMTEKVEDKTKKANKIEPESRDDTDGEETGHNSKVSKEKYAKEVRQKGLAVAEAEERAH